VANLDLPAVPVFLAPLLLPTVLVLCQHAFFHGQAVIVVPYDSPITSIELLKNVLESLDAVAVKLSPLKDFSSLLLAMRGVTVALGLPAVFVATSPNHKNGIPHLNEISLPDKVSANDRMSSLIFMGGGKSKGARLLPRKVECFRNHEYGTGEGYFIVVAAEMSALVYDLRDTPLWSVPIGRVTVCKGEAFNDKLSSVRFDYGSDCPTAT
jgi:hypothetical protein